MIPPHRPWVLECACGRIRHAIADALLVCDYCDRPLAAAPRPVWPHENAIYAAAGQQQPTWSQSEPLGLCPLVCPDHRRHCDNDQNHPGEHACSLCPNWSPR